MCLRVILREDGQALTIGNTDFWAADYFLYVFVILRFLISFRYYGSYLFLKAINTYYSLARGTKYSKNRKQKQKQKSARDVSYSVRDI